jgi:hypothetical protein
MKSEIIHYLVHKREGKEELVQDGEVWSPTDQIIRFLQRLQYVFTT